MFRAIPQNSPIVGIDFEIENGDKLRFELPNGVETDFEDLRRVPITAVSRLWFKSHKYRFWQVMFQGPPY